MALQEFLASYAVKVDEDGARRLQRILDQNQKSASDLTSSFNIGPAGAVAAEGRALGCLRPEGSLCLPGFRLFESVPAEALR